MGQPRVPIVPIAAADETQLVALVQNVPYEVPLDRAVNRRGRIESLAAAVDGNDLGNGLELRIGRKPPVGGHRSAGGMMSESQGRGAPQRIPELQR